jgi:serine/threonine protein kinase
MFDIFEDEKYYYLVMELLSGGEVSKFLTERLIAFRTNYPQRKVQ